MLTGGNNNIYIANSGVDGDESTARIGEIVTRTFIAGIRPNHAARFIVNATSEAIRQQRLPGEG
jgi:hypothetical protein